MPESYSFPTYSGIFEGKHVKRIGSALWLFLWLVSKTTKEVERDGTKWGIVLGNKPLKLDEIAEEFDTSKRTIQRWIETLEKHDYVRVTRAPYGLIVTVKNSKKFNYRDDKSVHTGQDKNVHSPETDVTEMSTHDDKSVHSNKDITGDIINTTTAAKGDEFYQSLNQLEQAYCNLHTILDIHVSSKDVESMKRVIAGGMPLPFIIRNMEQIYQRKKEKGERVRSFSYYEDPISEAWEKEQSKKGGVDIDFDRRSSKTSSGNDSADSFGGYYDQYDGLIQKL